MLPLSRASYRSATTFLIATIAVALSYSCGSAFGPHGEDATTQIENQSQFDLLELRVHTGLEYLNADNLLTEPLAPGESFTLERSGELYVTVYRERYAQGPIYAFTTAYPIVLSDDTTYRLSVFDESFRLE